jgi:mRNA-degrading endonuclease toxin of MazEF toxin-antitoxin module
MHAVTARITSRARDRSIPTAVEVDPDHENRLHAPSYVLCHDLLTVPQIDLSAPFGRLGPADLFAVEAALRYALSLGS